MIVASTAGQWPPHLRSLNGGNISQRYTSAKGLRALAHTDKPEPGCELGRGNAPMLRWLGWLVACSLAALCQTRHDFRHPLSRKA